MAESSLLGLPTALGTCVHMCVPLGMTEREAHIRDRV